MKSLVLLAAPQRHVEPFASTQLCGAAVLLQSPGLLPPTGPCSGKQTFSCILKAENEDKTVKAGAGVEQAAPPLLNCQEHLGPVMLDRRGNA